MERPQTLIIGCGLIGNAVGIQLSQHHLHKVYGIRRHTHQIANCITPISIDLNRSSAQWKTLPKVDNILISLTPNTRTPEGYRQCYVQNVDKIVKYYDTEPVKYYFLSSTSVYGDNQGEVDINSPIEPNNWNGEILCEAENFLSSNTTATIINSAGIYGMMRWWLFDYLSGKKKSALNLRKISNRIHQQDLINFISQLIASSQSSTQQQNKRYILADNQPTSYHQIINCLHQQHFPLDETIKQEFISYERSSGLDEIGKRCINNINELRDFQLLYPTYQIGLKEQLKCWQGWQKLTNFQQQILSQVYQIPWGKTQSYRQIGESIDSKAYRAIGQALKKNPCAPWIPCHRVIASNGTIGGFMGTNSGDAIDEKRQLLAQENVFL